jgi:hypothetical protein
VLALTAFLFVVVAFSVRSCVCAGKSQDAAKAEYIALVEALAANDK